MADLANAGLRGLLAGQQIGQNLAVQRNARDDYGLRVAQFDAKQASDAEERQYRRGQDEKRYGLEVRQADRLDANAEDSRLKNIFDVTDSDLKAAQQGVAGLYMQGVTSGPAFEQGVQNLRAAHKARLDASAAYLRPRAKRVLETADGVAGALESGTPMAEIPDDQLYQWAGANLGRDPLEAIDDSSELGPAADQFFEAMQKGDQAGMLSASSVLLAPEASAGIGSYDTAGRETVGKKIVDVLPYPGDKDGRYGAVALEVSKRGPDGKVTTERRPVTNNRSSEDDDVVTPVDLRAQMERAAHTALLVKQLRRPGVREKLAAGQQAGSEPVKNLLGLLAATGFDYSKIAEAERKQEMHDAKLGLVTAQTGAATARANNDTRNTNSLISTRGERAKQGGSARAGAQQQYLQFVADKVFGGDLKKAYSSIRGGNARQIAASMATGMAKQQENMPRSKQRPYKDLYAEAMTILQGAADVGGDNGGDDASGLGADEQAELDALREEQE